MKPRWIILAVALASAALAGWWIFARPGEAVEVLRPQRGTIRAFVEEQAVTELPQDYLISMPIAGWLEPITLREGDEVKQGQVVARLERDDLTDRVRQAEQRIAVLKSDIEKTSDNRLEQNALVQAEASVKALDETVQASERKLEAAQAVLDFARSELDRLSALTETDAATVREIRAAEMEARRARAEHQSDALNTAALKTIAAVSYISPKFILDYIDRKKFELESFRRQLEEANLALEIEKRNLARAEITSSIDGVVLKRHQTRRQYLQAGTDLLTIGRLQEMEISAEVLTERATRIRPGNPVEIFGEAIQDGPLPGEVLRIYPAGFMEVSSLGVEQQRVNVVIGLSRRPPELGVAYRVQVRIFYDQATDALILPRTALFRAPRGEWQVMIVEGGRTRLQQVSLGLMNDDQAQVLDGLTAENLVVARPSRDLRAGTRVEPELSH